MTMTASQFNDLYSARTRAIIHQQQQAPRTAAPYASYYHSNSSCRHQQQQQPITTTTTSTATAYPSPVFPRSTTSSAYGYMSRY